jgi:hypothetical protein
MDDHRMSTAIRSRSFTRERDERSAHGAPMTVGDPCREEVETGPLRDLRESRPHREMDPRLRGRCRVPTHREDRHDGGGDPGVQVTAVVGEHGSYVQVPDAPEPLTRVGARRKAWPQPRASAIAPDPASRLVSALRPLVARVGGDGSPKSGALWRVTTSG